MRAALAHGAGFLISGALAFSTDAGVLWLLTRSGTLDPYTARLAAIAVAMVVAYFAHRTLTFAVKEPPSLHQFGRFCSVAASANALNYAIYAGILFAWPASATPLLALLIATTVAMVASYLGLRLGVFRAPTP